MSETQNPAPAPATAAEPEEPLAVDPEAEYQDTDSAVGDVNDRVSSFTQSLTSSVLRYQEEYGRRYHAGRPETYVLPNDEPELDRLDMMHHLLTREMGDKLFLAPVKPDRGIRIMDIGTGTGIWAIAMGDQYPMSEILGNDLSPVQPLWVPPNVKFEVDDVEKEWIHSIPFDFIFCRYLMAAIENWPRLMKSCYDNLNAGGWIEFQDFDLSIYSDDGSLKEEHYLKKWIDYIIEAADKNGRTACPGRSLEQWAKDAGFTNVGHKAFRIPVGRWPKDKLQKEVGTYNLLQILEGLHAFTYRLYINILGWSADEVEVFLAKVRHDLMDKTIHSQYNYHVVYGQKPVGGQQTSQQPETTTA